MDLFKKRETVIQNITYMALMAAINVVFVLLTALLPPLMFLMVFILPMTSAVVTLFCKKRYFPIYFVATMGLCLLTTSALYIWDTFFYVLPSLITGFVFGLVIEKQVPSIFIILLTTVVQYIISLLTFIIIKSIVPELNYIEVLLGMFGLKEFAYKEVFAHIFIYTISSIQMVLTYFVLRREIKKLGFEINLIVSNPTIVFVLNLMIIIMSFVSFFIYQPIVYVFLIMNLPLFVFELVEISMEKKAIDYVLLGLSVLVSSGIFLFFYNLLPHPYGLILIAPLYLLVGVIYFLNYLFNIKTKNDKIGI